MQRLYTCNCALKVATAAAYRCVAVVSSLSANYDSILFVKGCHLNTYIKNYSD